MSLVSDDERIVCDLLIVERFEDAPDFQVKTLDHLDQCLALFLSGRIHRHIWILIRRVRSLKRQENEEWLFTLGLDKANRLVGKDRVRPDAFTIERFAVFVEVVLAGSFKFVRIVIVIKVKADPAVEAEIIGPAAIQIGYVPLAKAARSIPGILHHLSDGWVVLWVQFGRAATVVVLVGGAKPCGIASGQKCSS